MQKLTPPQCIGRGIGGGWPGARGLVYLQNKMNTGNQREFPVPVRIRKSVGLFALANDAGSRRNH